MWMDETNDKDIENEVDNTTGSDSELNAAVEDKNVIETTVEETQDEPASDEMIYAEDRSSKIDEVSSDDNDDQDDDEIVSFDESDENTETSENSEPPALTEVEEKAVELTVEEQMQRLKGKVEAALFVTGKALALEDIAEIVDCQPDDAEMALVELIQDYMFRENCSLEIDDTDGYILQVKEEYSSVVNKMMPLEISAATLRTLSAIAIKAPVLQSDLIELRGSTAYDHIGELLALKMISKKRKGRSYMLNTTRNFYEYFKFMGDKKELEMLMRKEERDRKIEQMGDDYDPNAANPYYTSDDDAESANSDDIGSDMLANDMDEAV